MTAANPFVVPNTSELEGVKAGVIALPPEPQKRKLTIRRPSEILAMEFDDSDRVIGDMLVALGQSCVWAGQGGIGKSRLLMQGAYAAILNREFISFQTRGGDLRWLILQSENTNRRLQSDLAALQRWAGRDSAKVDEQLRIHTLENDEDGFLTLSVPENQTLIAEAIEETQPDIVCFDPLGEFGVGNLNDDECMRDTCRTISRLVKKGNPNRATIVLHHATTGKAGIAKATGYDRAGFARNSKVLQAWTRAQINFTPGSPDSNDTLVVSCGKCSNGKEFPSFAVRLNPETMIYEVDKHFDLEAWQAEVTGAKAKGPAVTVEMVTQLCVCGPTKKELATSIIEESGCGKSYAYKMIDAAEKAKKVKRHPVSKTYAKC